MQLVVNIVVLASIYALIACGYVLIYRVSRVLNLAHGELMMLGAYLLLATASLFNGHPVIALGRRHPAEPAWSASLVYVFLMRKMTGEMVLAAVLTTVALGILLRGLVVLIWSAQQQYPAQALGVAEPVAGAVGRRAHLAVVRRAGRDHCRRLCGAVRCSCASAAGACACAPPGRTRCSRRSAASTCTASMRWPGAFRRSPARSPAC